MSSMEQRAAGARELHRTIDFLGLRAHATTVGLIQLCEELLKVGILDAPALERIKDSIRMELTLSQARISNQTLFDETLRRRLDAIFPHCGSPKEPVGEIHDLEEALDPDATH
ncbi:hypothetical protein [Sphingopyxis indica]|uniref:Uncharacterized protein n=1 Tax=Sphingopyxis indica TaxID=436663 RepID=A0A239KV15_9SPHN|nr:hypothetical protein [Sphingopyxis indica]WOF41926.1 hypothetical protein KNJ79_11825 [Sphingopyxis indica]SNT21433.1 hypothetical protein SAMN06295955_11652 [Sphingopyxis indica]